jgi:hypothetical protein
MVENAFGESLFEGRIEAMEQKLQAAKTIREILAQYPDLLMELGLLPHAVTVSPARGASQAPTGIRLKRKSNFARIRSFFVQHKNEWFEAPRIGEALGLTRGTVATVLWTSHADQFEKKPVEGSEKKKLWRLRQDVYEDTATREFRGPRGTKEGV